ncbi:MAG: SCO family protein [Alphaproteobacteria bacterium]|jgi:protein SCO1/2|nr:SCO family protein [Alphaproteobacteria bacterium]
MGRWIRRALLMLLPALIMPAAAQDLKIGGPFALIDQDGRPVTDADFRGRPLLVYFGLTYCPDICPTDLAVIAETMGQLGPAADGVQALFVTVDPERDTPAQLRDYTALFDRRIRGLTGDVKAVAAAARAYRVTYAKYDIQGPLDYRMDHSAYIYLMNRDGRFVARFPQGTAPETLADALRAQLGS